VNVKVDKIYPCVYQVAEITATLLMMDKNVVFINHGL